MAYEQETSTAGLARGVMDDLANQSPDQIESQIETTRASLDRKLGELERRLTPREQVASLKREAQARAPQLLAWGAVAAVATGMVMAVSGWRRTRTDVDLSTCGPLADSGML